MYRLRCITEHNIPSHNIEFCVHVLHFRTLACSVRRKKMTKMTRKKMTKMTRKKTTKMTRKRTSKKTRKKEQTSQPQPQPQPQPQQQILPQKKRAVSFVVCFFVFFFQVQEMSDDERLYLGMTYHSSRENINCVNIQIP